MEWMWAQFLTIQNLDSRYSFLHPYPDLIAEKLIFVKYNWFQGFVKVFFQKII